MNGKNEHHDGEEALQVELGNLDLRYEGCRTRSSLEEKRLEASILEHGILEAVEGTRKEDALVVLDGFKRIRCARKLKIGLIPFISRYADETEGVVEMLKRRPGKAMTILEQSLFIDRLRREQGMTVTEMSERLGRSRGWISVRQDLLSDLGTKMKAELLSGRFPVYPYMYVLRPFMRMNKGSRPQVEEFMGLVSGQHLSHREIEQLAVGFLQGPELFRQQLRSGNLRKTLDDLLQIGCGELFNEMERGTLKDLEKVDDLMRRLPPKLLGRRLTKRSFFAQAHLVTGGILLQSKKFLKGLKEFHDRTGKM